MTRGTKAARGTPQRGCSLDGSSNPNCRIQFADRGMPTRMAGAALVDILALCTGGCDPSGSAADFGAGRGRDAGLSDAGPPDAACATRWRLCGSTCVNVQADLMNCGASGNGCTGGHSWDVGMCRCTMGLTSCRGIVDCLNRQPDAANYGEACVSTQTCVACVCACPAGQMLGGSSGLNSWVDPKRCGRCGNLCPSAKVCASGACACPTADQTYCGGSGPCVGLSPHGGNCGSRDHARGTNQACTAGTYACSAGTTPRADAMGCVHLQTADADCGPYRAVRPAAETRGA